MDIGAPASPWDESLNESNAWKGQPNHKAALKGHGFSHAISPTKSSSALAAEGRSFDD
jgi:hypothetical protein